jgi:hypothetical protein
MWYDDDAWLYMQSFGGHEVYPLYHRYRFGTETWEVFDPWEVVKAVFPDTAAPPFSLRVGLRDYVELTEENYCCDNVYTRTPERMALRQVYVMEKETDRIVDEGSVVRYEGRGGFVHPAEGTQLGFFIGFGSLGEGVSGHSVQIEWGTIFGGAEAAKVLREDGLCTAEQYKESRCAGTEYLTNGFYIQRMQGESFFTAKDDLSIQIAELNQDFEGTANLSLSALLQKDFSTWKTRPLLVEVSEDGMEIVSLKEYYIP